MWKRTHREAVPSRADQLVLECDALLAGGYADFLRRQGRPVPAWALVNAMAHASRHELEAWAADDDTAIDPDVVGTHQLRAFLADDVLRHAGPDASTLIGLQRSRLIPLELDLLREVEPSGHDPGRVTRLVMAAVRHPQRST